MKKNTGKEYEIFVADLCNAILNAELINGQKNIQVEVNKFLTGTNGIRRQFDIYWEYELGGFIYKNIIECKDYQTSISIDRIDGLVGKLRDFPDLKGIFATKNGYQSGAETKARQDGIELLIVRDENDTDWIDKNGTPLVKSIHLNINILHPVAITHFNILGTTDFSLTCTAKSDEILIKNAQTGEEYDLFQLESQLNQNHNQEEYGIFKKEEIFDGQLTYSNKEYPIKGYEVTYKQVPPIKMNTKVTGSLFGVIEYLNQDKKIKVLENGTLIKE